MKSMGVTRHKQTGASPVTWMLLSVAVGLSIMTVLKLAPVYIEHVAVTSSMDSLRTEASLKGGNVNDVRDALVRRLDINDVERVTRDHITITRDMDNYIVNVKYDVGLHYVHNISLLISFDDTVEVPIR